MASSVNIMEEANTPQLTRVYAQALYADLGRWNKSIKRQIGEETNSSGPGNATAREDAELQSIY